MYGQFCVGFFGRMLANKKWNGFTLLLSHFDFEENESIILKYFTDE